MTLFLLETWENRVSMRVADPCNLKYLAAPASARCLACALRPLGPLRLSGPFASYWQSWKPTAPWHPWAATDLPTYLRIHRLEGASVRW
jgi:hypothetical protein